MTRYLTKPVEVQVWQWLGQPDHKIPDWVDDYYYPFGKWLHHQFDSDSAVDIGEYLIKHPEYGILVVDNLDGLEVVE